MLQLEASGCGGHVALPTACPHRGGIPRRVMALGRPRTMQTYSSIPPSLRRPTLAWGCQQRQAALRPTPPQLRVARAAAAAATAAAGAAAVGSSSGLEEPDFVPPTPLPPPPRSSRLGDVLPYLLRLALGDPQLHWRLGAALVLLLASKAAGLLAPLYFKQAVDALSLTAASSSGGSSGAAAAAVGAAVLAVAISGACRAASGLAKELQHPIFTPVSQAAGRRLSYYALSHVLNLDLQFHLNRRTGALSRMLERGTRSVAMIFRAVVFTFMPTAVELCLVCGILARTFHPRVSLVVLATFVAYAGWTVALTQAATRLRRSVKELDNAITGKAVDALLNYETVALFGNQALETRQYDASLERYQAAAASLEGASAALNAGQAIILSGGLTAVLVAAIKAGGGITPGDLVLIQGMLLQLWAPLNFLGWFFRELRQSLVDCEDLFRLLETQSSLPDGTLDLPPPPTAAQGPPGQQHGGSALASSSSSSSSSSNGTSSSSASNGVHTAPAPASHNGTAASLSAAATAERGAAGGRGGEGLRVELHDVEFGYSGGRQVLRGVSIVAEPGESIAVVGPSGSGKSTVLRLLVRLYDVDKGAVLLGGHDVRELRQESLRAAVAVVPQDTVLFNDTILHNVSYGRPGASLEEVQAAASAAQLDSAIARWPAGWQTVVGERGLKLSGGEKQRVAIARAFLRAPRLLVCDEATSSLDTATERSIMASLEELAEGRTSVFVAHRLSTIQGCDRIYVLSEGVVVECGTHDQLMAAGGVYQEMWRMQEAEEALEEHLHARPPSPAAAQDPQPAGI